MPTIDFTNIRSAPKSKNDSFEALSVQLFRFSCEAPEGSSFYSLRGDGGDGGVEAYFRAPNGNVFGVQAKYFFQLGAKELGQITKSVTAARLNHPTLSEYWIYIPFDLTGKVAGGARGQGEVERFESWKEELEQRTDTEGQRVKIILCSATVMREQLQRLDTHGGIRRYWFDDSVLTPVQVQQCLDQAREFAGPRYMGQLDVVTDAHDILDFFGGTADFSNWRRQTFSPVVRELESLRRRTDDVFDLFDDDKKAEAVGLLEKLSSHLAEVRQAEKPEQGVTQALKTVTQLQPILLRAKECQEAAFAQQHGVESDTPSFRQFHAEYMCAFPAGAMDSARELFLHNQAVEKILTCPQMNVAEGNSLLLVGPAGAGKTHAIVSAAYRRFAEGGLSLVVFGDDFDGGEPWETIRSKLGFGAQIGRDDLFQCLSTSAEHADLPFVIYIDALNESRTAARWKAKLPELIQQCKPYTGIKICVSARDTYKDLVTDSRFPGYAFEHRGFNGQGVEALQAFADFYGLDSEITPLFSEELSNPLFLHLACKTLQEEGSKTLDVSLPGFSALLERHLKHSNVAVKERLGYSSPKNLVRQSMLTLAQKLTSASASDRLWESCAAGLRDVVGPELTPEVFIQELQREGLVILTEGSDDDWTVRLGYERYGDVLRAIALVDGHKNESGELDVKKLGISLVSLPLEDRGLLEVLSAVLPEKTGIEIVNPDLGLDVELANRLFVHGLAWRSTKSFDIDGLEDEIFAALEVPGLWEDIYEVFVKVSLVPNHRLNAELWLDHFLIRQPLVNRDVYLSRAAFKSYDNNGAVKSLLNASLTADIKRWPSESRRLATIVLGWLTSSADRRVRDQASKGLVRLIVADPALSAGLAVNFMASDDDYIIESVAEAIYSACLIAREQRLSFIPALRVLVSHCYDRTNVIIRDSIRMLAKLVEDQSIDEPLRKRLEQFPSKSPAIQAWPTLVDAKPLLDLEHLPSDMKLWGSNIGPDFWRYQVERKVSGFDLKAASLTKENIACWIMVETLRLGFPGYKQGALNYDRALNSEFGSGRARAGYAERLGKKYYWISLHRLLGVLSDHIPPCASYQGTAPGPDFYWSVDVRKRDLTDMRDVISDGTYPDSILRRREYAFPSHECDVKKWVKTDDFASHETRLSCTDASGVVWIALQRSEAANDLGEEDSWTTPYLSFDVFYTSVLADENVFGMRPYDLIDRAFSDNASFYRSFLGEYPDGAAFDQLVEEGSTNTHSDGLTRTMVTLSRGGEWEYEFTSETDQPSLDVPCQDLVKALGLIWDQQRGWLDEAGTLVAFTSGLYRNNALFIRKSALDSFLEQTGKSLLYRRFANRGFIDQRGDTGSQIDLTTYLKYIPNEGLTVVHEESELFE
ncbi:TPA: ATP-binding protein [Pseudomonas putida]|uniref:ATP-binding protein n=1 Tax=Pseudomonas putida TaxID=303 RepID=UPI00235C7847|nr:ATP-binding protein [Pseudomonas putida]GLO20098.1 serine protease [Pseudomonas putida]HDS0998250.1 ATP-binding protein [Pseudomonas putida]HDS1763384.1 ATP-binding protein [Pseudomonas putida]